MSAPVVAQYISGPPGFGGTSTALDRVMKSKLGQSYSFVEMRGIRPAGGLKLDVVWQYREFVKSVRPDIVHVRGLGNGAFHAVLGAKLAGCERILLSVHSAQRDIQVPMTIRRAVVVSTMEPASMLMATHIATVCRWGSDRYLKGRHRHKLVGVVPNGVEVTPSDEEDRQALRSDLGIAREDVALVIVGRLSVDKGHLVLAKALARLGDDVRRMPLLVVGDGPDRHTIEAAYRGVLRLRLKLLGTRHDVPRILNAADIFVFPSLHENLSNALLEGMAAGLPVIAAKVGGNLEVLGRGGGLMLPPGDSVRLADAIIEMAGRPSRRKELGDAGRLVIEECFTLDHMLSGWDSVYRKVLGTP